MVHGSYICGHFRSRTAFLILTVKSMSLLVQIAKNYCKHPKLNTQWRESKNKEQWTTLTLLFEVDLSNGQVPGPCVLLLGVKLLAFWKSFSQRWLGFFYITKLQEGIFLKSSFWMSSGLNSSENGTFKFALQIFSDVIPCYVSNAKKWRVGKLMPAMLVVILVLALWDRRLLSYWFHLPWESWAFLNLTSGAA
jgi:hypothetical protein